MKNIITALSGATTTTTSAVVSQIDKINEEEVHDKSVCQSTITGTGALTATVEIYGNTTRQNTGGVLIDTHTLSGTTTATAGKMLDGPWPYMYAKVTAITGTGAAITTIFVV